MVAQLVEERLAPGEEDLASIPAVDEDIKRPTNQTTKPNRHNFSFIPQENNHVWSSYGMKHMIHMHISKFIYNILTVPDTL